MANSLEEFYQNCQKLADSIRSNEAELTTLLSKYETFQTVEDELERSVEALEGMSKEFASIQQPLQGLTIATFFPLN